MEIGIIGLPNSGKTTIFNLLTQGSAQTAGYPFSTVQPNIGVANVPDEPLVKLASIVSSDNVTHASIKFIDVPGLIEGASKGEGLGNQFLSYIRDVDAIVHVVRCFASPDISHPGGIISPEKDIEIVNVELSISDIKILERQMEKSASDKKAGDESAKEKLEFLNTIHNGLAKGNPLHEMEFTKEEKEFLRHIPLLTAKPVIYIANVDENPKEPQSRKFASEVKSFAEREKALSFEISAKIQEELLGLSPEERKDFLEGTGRDEEIVTRFLKSCVKMLGLITFYTVERKIVKSWLVRSGTDVITCAGKIHSEMQSGFIKAEVINFQDFEKAGRVQNIHEHGMIRVEGKNYTVQDGDIIWIRFRSKK